MDETKGKGGRLLACLALAYWVIPASAQQAGQRIQPNHSAHGAAPRSAPAELPRALPQPMAASTQPRAASVAPAPVSGPALADLERMAIERNPTLRQAAAQFDAARSRSFQAGLYPNPQIGYVQEQIGALGEVRPTSGGVVTRGPRTPGELVGGFVQQEIVTGGKLRLSRAKFAEEATAAQWQLEAQKLRVLNSVRIRYYDVLAAQRLVKLREEMLRLTEEAARTTADLKNVGQANDPDVLQARVEARRARVALRNAESDHRSAWNTLVAYVGVPELLPVLLDERPLEADAPPIDHDVALAEILRCSPEVQASHAEIRRDHIMVQRERREPIPNVTIQGVAGYNYEFGLPTAGVQVSLPLPVFNRNQGTVREAMADLSRDRAESERVILSLRQRMADAYDRFEDASESVNDFREESLPLARQAYELQLANFRGQRGARAAWPQVLVAQRNYLDLSREYIQSLQDLRRAEVEIRGMLLVDGLSSPGTPTSQGHIEAVAQPR